MWHMLADDIEIKEERNGKGRSKKADRDSSFFLYRFLVNVGTN